MMNSPFDVFFRNIYTGQSPEFLITSNKSGNSASIGPQDICPLIWHKDRLEVDDLELIFPITFAVYVLPSTNVISAVLAPSTTWVLVIM